MIQLFDIKTRTLGFAFCQPPKMSLPKSLTQKKSLQNFKPKKSPQIANFKPKKGLRTSPSLIYLSTPPGSTMYKERCFFFSWMPLLDSDLWSNKHSDAVVWKESIQISLSRQSGLVGSSADIVAFTTEKLWFTWVNLKTYKQWCLCYQAK